MIVITGATGEYGRLVLEHLLERVSAPEIAVAVRDPRKARSAADRGVEVRQCDYEQPGSLRESFAGADRLLFVSAPTWDSQVRLRQHHHVVRAASDGAVGLLAYTSALGADVSDEGGLSDHHATEEEIRRSGVPHTMLRHPIYSEWFINPELEQAIESGELVGSTGGRGMNTAIRDDLAEAAAVVLTSPRPAAHYNLTGRLWTYPELAQVLSELSGRPVTHRETDEDEGIMQMIGPAIRSGAFEWQTEDLQRLLGRPSTSLEDAVRAVLPTELLRRAVV